jgi:hypothetical protein
LNSLICPTGVGSVLIDDLIDFLFVFVVLGSSGKPAVSAADSTSELTLDEEKKKVGAGTNQEEDQKKQEWE